jgi:phosphatidate phosphatase APP1
MIDEVEPAGAPVEPNLRVRLKAKLGLIGDLRLVGYLSHGTQRYLHIKGRLIEAKGEGGDLGEDRSLLRNVLTTIRRMNSDEMPGALLSARFLGRSYDVYTDNEGYFQLNLYPDDPLEEGWNDVEIELVESIKKDAQACGTARVFVPPERSEFAIVSDIDDTLIESSATDKLAQARLTLFEHASTRVCFPGVASLYASLVRGTDGEGCNPIFYVSRTGWNLYDLFIEFFELNEIPLGPMFLRDLSFREEKSTALGSSHHKLTQIRELLRVYPTLPFVLIGDSGQHDAERYRQIVLENPGRVRAVYLRDVTHEKRDGKVHAIAADLRRRGVVALVSEHSEEFAEHMRGEGLIVR